MSETETSVEQEVETLIKTIDPRTIPVRFSRLKHMARSAAHYRQSCQDTNEDPSLALRLGIGTHALVFGQPVAEYTRIRRGKLWEAYRAEKEAAGIPILNVREHAEATAIANSIRSNPLAADILLHPSVTVEDHIDWDIAGRSATSRPDAYAVAHPRLGSFVADLKTARDAAIEWFQREAWKMFYPAQCEFYKTPIERKTGVRPERAFLVAIEKKPPYAISVHELTDELMAASRAIIQQWLARLAECEATDVWPGYGNLPNTFDLPARKPWEMHGSGFDDDVDFEETTDDTESDEVAA